MDDSDFCSICNSPKQAKSAGSFTQWIATCSCDLKASEEAQKLSVHICTTCGKRIGKGRQGSFTQFIFRADICDCDRPTPAPELVDSFEQSLNDTSELEYANEIELIEDELSVDDNDFPVERYKPIELLGSGTSGLVYKARDRLLNKLVAVKTMNVRSSEQLVKFQEEAKATSILKHESIVKVMDFGVTDSEVPYMVLEYLESCTLEERLSEKERLPWWQVQSIILDMCDALAYAHENGIFHRDLKPGNILLQFDENDNVSVKIIDFGLAKITNKDEEASGEKTGIVGTPYYMSPDQGLGLDFDARSEIYSFGCVLFEMLTGKVPFAGETPLQTLSMHANSPAPRISDLTGIIFLDEIEELVSKCLAKDREKRFSSFVEVRQFVGGISQSGRHEDETEYGDTVSGESVKADNKARLVKTAIVSSFVLLIGAGAYFLYSSYTAALKKAKENKIVIKVESPAKQREVINSLSVPLEDHVFGGTWEIISHKSGEYMAEGKGVTDEDFKKLDLSKKFTRLKIKLSDDVTGEGLVYLKSKPLRSIEIVSTRFNDQGAKNLLLFPKLRTFQLKFSNELTEAGIDEIGKLKKLETIQFWNMRLPKNTLQMVSKLKRLTLVDLGNCKPVPLDGVKELSKLPRLNVLKICGGSQIDDSYGEAFANTTATNFLINGTGVSMKTVKRLAKLKRTKVIRVSLGESITKLSLKTMKEKYPKIGFVAVDIFNTRIPIK